MSLNYVLVVSAPVYGRQASLSAYRFAQAVIEQGHADACVFLSRWCVECIVFDCACKR